MHCLFHVSEDVACLPASLEMISFDFEPMVGHLLTRDADCWLSSCVAKRGRVDSAAVRVSANHFAQGVKTATTVSE